MITNYKQTKQHNFYDKNYKNKTTMCLQSQLMVLLGCGYRGI